MNLAKKVAVFQKQIIQFWKTSGRKHLPWRKTRDPWKLLMAEILLRKTTSSQAADVFIKLEALTPSDISNINIADLEKTLAPLGIYRIRAMQLKLISEKAAGFTRTDYQSDEKLRSLSGVGRYISNSVRCFAFGFAVPALDTNMIRILERVFGWQTHRSRAREDKELWKNAEDLVPKNLSREYNWGILDFGAVVCTARNPKCTTCPINNICVYYQTLIRN